MYIGFEIDNIISTPVVSLSNVNDIAKQTVIDEARELLMEIKAAGHSIVLCTQRDASMALDTEVWLQKNKIPYDRISFNRPRLASMFFSLDSRRFTGWDKVREELVGNGLLKEKHEDTGGSKDGGAAEADSSAGRKDSEKLDEASGGTGTQGPAQGGTIQDLKPSGDAT